METTNRLYGRKSSSPSSMHWLSGKSCLLQKISIWDGDLTMTLIYPTLMKSAIFTVVLACFKLLEDVAVGLYREVLRRKHCRPRRRYLADTPDSDSSLIRGAHPFCRIRRTAKNYGRGQIETDVFLPTLTKPLNKGSGVVDENWQCHLNPRPANARQF